MVRIAVALDEGAAVLALKVLDVALEIARAKLRATGVALVLVFVGGRAPLGGGRIAAAPFGRVQLRAAVAVVLVGGRAPLGVGRVATAPFGRELRAAVALVLFGGRAPLGDPRRRNRRRRVAAPLSRGLRAAGRARRDDAALVVGGGRASLGDPRRRRSRRRRAVAPLSGELCQC